VVSERGAAVKVHVFTVQCMLQDSQCVGYSGAASIRLSTSSVTSAGPPTRVPCAQVP
jgi:hypothetical protein